MNNNNIINIKNHNTYKDISQQIYEILVNNNEKFNFNYNYLLCNYNKLSINSKNEIDELIKNKNSSI